MLLHPGGIPVLVVSSAGGAREILETDDLAFSNRTKSIIARKILYDYKDAAFTPYGEYWRHIKGICMFEVLSSKRVRSFRSMREEETALLIQKIKQHGCSASSPTGNLTEMMVEHTNNVTWRAAMGRKHGGNFVGDAGGGRSFKELLAETGALPGVFDVGDFIPWLGWLGHLNGLYARADKLAKELDTFTEFVVQEHEERERNGGERVTTESRRDFVDVLFQIQEG